MKKLTALLLILVIALSLGACTSDKDDDSPAADSAANQDTPPSGPVQNSRAVITAANAPNIKELMRTEIGVAHHVTIHPDGKIVASAKMFEPTITMWEIATGQPVGTHTLGTDALPMSGVLALAFTPDGHLLAVGNTSDHDRILLWDVTTNQTLLSVEQKTNPQQTPFTLDGRVLVVSAGGGLTWRDTAAGVIRGIPAHDSDIDSLALSADGTIAVTGEAPEVRVWNLATSTMLGEYTAEWSQVALSADGRLLALTHDSVENEEGSTIGGHVWIVEIATGAVPHVLTAGSASLLAFNPEGTLLATYGSRGMVYIWDVTTGAEVAQFQAEKGNQMERVDQLVFSLDGTLLATIDGDELLQIWGVE